jgi:hypothetical protein
MEKVGYDNQSAICWSGRLATLNLATALLFPS